jgi:hypothetical protein
MKSGKAVSKRVRKNHISPSFQAELSQSFRAKRGIPLEFVPAKRGIPRSARNDRVGAFFLKNLCDSLLVVYVAPTFRWAFARIHNVSLKADATKALPG